MDFQRSSSTLEYSGHSNQLPNGNREQIYEVVNATCQASHSKHPENAHQMIIDSLASDEAAVCGEAPLTHNEVS